MIGADSDALVSTADDDECMELVQPMSRGPTLGGDGTSGIVAPVGGPQESTRLPALDGTDVYTELAKALTVPQTALVRV